MNRGPITDDPIYSKEPPMAFDHNKIVAEWLTNYKKISENGKALREKIYGDGYQDGHKDGYDKGYDDAQANNSRPQGRWIRYRDNPHQPEHIKCSNCGQYWSIADHDKIFDICFKCGAKMKGNAE